MTDKNYIQMVRMHVEYSGKGFEILGFPCNQFGAQEPASNENIKIFARELYGAQWPLFAKSEVNGPRTSEVYKFLRINSRLNDSAHNQVQEIPWNFAKFIVNGEGKVVSYHEPREDPESLRPIIEGLLGLK